MEQKKKKEFRKGNEIRKLNLMSSLNDYVSYVKSLISNYYFELISLAITIYRSNFMSWICNYYFSSVKFNRLKKSIH